MIAHYLSPIHGNLAGIDSEFRGKRKWAKTLKMNRLFTPFSLPDAESIYFPPLSTSLATKIIVAVEFFVFNCELGD
jgi:hypothetical protein